MPFTIAQENAILRHGHTAEQCPRRIDIRQYGDFDARWLHGDCTLADKADGIYAGRRTLGNHPRVEPLNQLKWTGVDFDGVIAQPSWPDPHPGPPMPGIGERLEALRSTGMHIAVFTARPWSEYVIVESYMDWYGFPHRIIVCGKLLTEVLIDDRAINSEHPDWVEATRRISEGH